MSFMNHKDDIVVGRGAIIMVIHWLVWLIKQICSTVIHIMCSVDGFTSTPFQCVYFLTHAVGQLSVGPASLLRQAFPRARSVQVVAVEAGELGLAAAGDGVALLDAVLWGENAAAADHRAQALRAQRHKVDLGLGGGRGHVPIRRDQVIVPALLIFRSGPAAELLHLSPTKQ